MQEEQLKNGMKIINIKLKKKHVMKLINIRLKIMINNIEKLIKIKWKNTRKLIKIKLKRKYYRQYREANKHMIKEIGLKK